MATATAAIEESQKRTEALAQGIVEAVTGAMQVYSIYIGDQLGFYEILEQDGPLTSHELARRSGTQERYVREWLEQQAVNGILDVEGDHSSGAAKFSLPPGHAEVLALQDNVNFLAPLAQLLVGAARPLESVLAAFRNGGGVPFSSYGTDAREGQARLNRPLFLNHLAQEWLAPVPGLDKRLRGQPPARVADIGCGGGWSSIGIARNYPTVRVDGYDLDLPSVDLAKKNVAAAGLQDRVRFYQQDAGAADVREGYDLVLAFECIHDMSDPVRALSAMRRLAKPGATVLVVDERVSEKFDPDAGLVERFMYGWSILHCLPVGMAEQPSAGTGTVMRPSVLAQYAREAGFSDVVVLPIEHLFFRFYQLKQ